MAHPRAYAALTGPFWPSVLEAEDAAWSGVALETRAPLLDRRMVRYLLRVPAMPWCMDKHLVRLAMRGSLPQETLSRPKSPLACDPLQAWSKQRDWSPLSVLDTINVNLFESMIDKGKLQNALAARTWLANYEDLRPVTLAWWLKSVEMDRGIQYSH